ncbi:MAG: TraM recognition domain-containing protein [Lachnospiraceae bacterium]|nr:TraM recognition domain-containing protein [Lachnospiraceae bacterium]
MSNKNNQGKTAQKQKRRIERQMMRHAFEGSAKDLKDTIKEIFTGNKDHSDSEYKSDFSRFKEQESDDYIKTYMTDSEKRSLKERLKSIPYTKDEVCSFVMFIMTIMIVMFMLLRYVYCFVYLKEKILYNNFFLILASVIIPVVIWAWSTQLRFWSYHSRKKVYFYLCMVNAVLFLAQPTFTFFRNIAVVNVVKLPTGRVFTEKMALFIAYLVVLGLVTLEGIVLYNVALPALKSDSTKRAIASFKWTHVIDNRKNKKNLYDIVDIEKLETSGIIRIKMMDRYLQSVIIGPSGTGKTSSIFLTVIASDMSKKYDNRLKRQEGLLKLVLEKKAKIDGFAGEITDENLLRDFDESLIKPVGVTAKIFKDNKKLIGNLYETYPDCGMTVVAPNPSMIEAIIRMASANSMMVNVLDPAHTYSQYDNVREVALNPFYIPLGLDEEERVIRIINAAQVFSDVLIATNKMYGDSDTYFTDISLAVSTNVAAIVMLAKNMAGEQAYIDDIHECISNFDNLKPYIEAIEKEFGINIQISTVGVDKGGVDFRSIVKNSNPGISSINADVDEASRKNPYYQSILFVKQELIGPGAPKMFDQERGLRNLVNKTLQDPRFKRKLSANESERLDFDKILSKNQITVVSTGIELAQSTSTSFGLFFLLLHRASVLRRPQENRSPHFLWVDECAQYVHPFFDDVIALYRQYKVAAVLTLQTLSQLEKYQMTSYLTDVFISAGTQFVFGRLSPDETKTFSDMAGTYMADMAQKSQTTNSIFSSNPSASETERLTPTQVNNLEASDIRNRDFQELTVYTVDNGRVLPAQLGQVRFIKDSVFVKRVGKNVLWKKVAPNAFVKPNDNIFDEEERKEDTVALKVTYNNIIPVEDEKKIITQVTVLNPELEENKEDKLQDNNIYNLFKSCKH